MKHIPVALHFAGVTLALLQAAPALAQSADASPPASPTPAAQSGDVEPGTIVVTAQRTAETLQRVPMAVSAFSGAQLDKLQFQSTGDLKLVIPNFSIERNLSNASTPKLYIRGIGVSNAAFSFDSPIGIYADDVYYPRVIGSLIDFIDVDRIEVLRGPQGTIYGRDASIGAVRVISKAPPLDGFDVKGDVTYGTANQFDTRASFGAALVPGKVGIRLSAVTNHNDGFETNTVNGEKVQRDNLYAFRGALLAQLSDDASLTLRGDYMHDGSRPTVGSNFLDNPDHDLRTFESELSYRDGSAVSLVETWGASLTGKVQLGDVALTSVTAYRGINQRETFDTDGTIGSSFEVKRGDLKESEFTQELYASGKRIAGLPVDWVVGGFYFHEPNDYVWALQIFSPPSQQTFHQLEDSIAGYAQGTFHLTDKLSVTGGARYTHDSKDFDAIGITATGAPDFTYHLRNNVNNKWTWRAAVNYQANRNLLVYASAATGFRAAALNGNAQSLAEVTGGAFGVESTLMYEAGLKSTFLDGHATFNAAGYYGKYTNLQQALTLPDGSVSTTNNDADVYGIELEAQVQPVQGLSLFGSLGTIHSNLKRSPLKLANAPKVDFNLGGTYSLDLANGGSFVLASTWHHESRQFGDVANTPILAIAAHDNVDASLTYNLPGDRIGVTLGGRNLTDKVYAIGGFFIANGAVSAVQFPSLPRRVYVKLSYRL